MSKGRWRAGACALVAGICCGCSSGSLLEAIDASLVGDVAAPPPPPVDAGIAPIDSSVPPPPLDAAASADVADAASAADTSTCAWHGTYESPACSDCLRTLCCVAVATCEGDTACMALDGCVSACLTGDAGDGGSISNCAQACADSRPQSVRTEWQALSNCVEFSCLNGGAGPCQ